MGCLPGPPLQFPLIKSMKTSTCLTQNKLLLLNRTSNFPLTLHNFKHSSTLIPLNAESSSENNPPSVDTEPGVTDPIKLAFAKAKAYKKAVQSNPIPKIVQTPLPDEDAKTTNEPIPEIIVEGKGEVEVPSSVKLAFLKAKEYNKNKNNSDIDGAAINSTNMQSLGLTDGNKKNTGNPAFRNDTDGAINSNEQSLGLTYGNEKNARIQVVRNDTTTKKDLKVSSIDFMGLKFSDNKKSKRLPAGLIPQEDLFPEGDMPEVEILVGNNNNMFEVVGDDDSSGLYKPKVSTWGVFPRPNNISQAFGGGRTIQPGEVLETAQDKASKQAHTQKLLATYKSKFGLNIDPKIKSECEQALKDGDSLMDLGKLKQALPFYEKVMDKLAFQNKLYGLAALQWSICQDSLTRPNEARIMYEKLQSHPDVNVRKKAKAFLFSFQAMDMMKVTSYKISSPTEDYRSYFEAFVKEEAVKINLEDNDEVDEGASLSQFIPYMIFLISPVFAVLLFAFLKRT